MTHRTSESSSTRRSPSARTQPRRAPPTRRHGRDQPRQDSSSHRRPSPLLEHPGSRTVHVHPASDFAIYCPVTVAERKSRGTETARRSERHSSSSEVVSDARLRVEELRAVFGVAQSLKPLTRSSPYAGHMVDDRTPRPDPEIEPDVESIVDDDGTDVDDTRHYLRDPDNLSGQHRRRRRAGPRRPPRRRSNRARGARVDARRPAPARVRIAAFLRRRRKRCSGRSCSPSRSSSWRASSRSDPSGRRRVR